MESQTSKLYVKSKTSYRNNVFYAGQSNDLQLV